MNITRAMVVPTICHSKRFAKQPVFQFVVLAMQRILTPSPAAIPDHTRPQEAGSPVLTVAETYSEKPRTGDAGPGLRCASRVLPLVYAPLDRHASHLNYSAREGYSFGKGFGMGLLPRLPPFPGTSGLGSRQPRMSTAPDLTAQLSGPLTLSVSSES